MIAMPNHQLTTSIEMLLRTMSGVISVGTCARSLINRFLGLLALLVLVTGVSAQELTVGQRIEGNLPSDGTTQSYQVTIDVAGSYVVSVSGPSTSTSSWSLSNPTVAILTESGQQLAFDDDNGPGYDPKLSLYLASGFYSVEVGSAWSESGGTYAVSLQKDGPDYQMRLPVITNQPQGVTVQEGDPVTFSVSVRYSGNPERYQWLQNGWPIWGATSSTYTQWYTQSWQNWSSYTVVVSNDIGSVESAPAYLQIQSQSTLGVGEVKEGSIDSSDQEDVYQVFINEEGYYRISVEGTSSSYDLSYPSFEFEDLYGNWVSEGSGYGRAVSTVYLWPSSFNLRVNPNSWPYLGSYAVSVVKGGGPVIQQQPRSTTTVASGQTVTWNVEATGSGFLQYQWTRNHVPIIGAVQSYLSVQAELGLNGSNFEVIVSDDTGSTTSDVAVLYVRSVESLSVGDALDRAISVVNEVDAYRINIARRGGYQFDAIAANRDATKTLSGAIIELLDIQGLTLYSSDDYYSYSFAQLFATLEAGTYFINVRGRYLNYSNQIVDFRTFSPDLNSPNGGFPQPNTSCYLPVICNYML